MVLHAASQAVVSDWPASPQQQGDLILNPSAAASTVVVLVYLGSAMRSIVNMPLNRGVLAFWKPYTQRSTKKGISQRWIASFTAARKYEALPFCS